jgi:DNA polymerase III alpha subunit
MRTDKYGQQIYTEKELCEIVMAAPERSISGALTEHPIHFSRDLELTNIPQILEWAESVLSTDDFDSQLQQNWWMPQEYKEFDIVKFLLDQCQNDEQLQRVGHELILYVDRNLLPLLQYLKYLVDTMRVNNVVWGVGRGSSVASYCLFLLGVHKIDSIYYGLEIEEFLR